MGPPQYAPAPCKWWLAAATQSFPVGRHLACRWCRSSYSIRIPSLKFIGLPVLKTWLIFGHGVKRAWWPWPLTFRPLNGVTGNPCHILPPSNFQLPTSFRSRLRIRHGTDRRTDGQTDNNHQCIITSPVIKNLESVTRICLLWPRPHRVGIMHWWLFVCLSVWLSDPCLILSRKRKGIGSWKSAGRKTTIRVTPFEDGA